MIGEVIQIETLYTHLLNPILSMSDGLHRFALTIDFIIHVFISCFIFETLNCTRHTPKPRRFMRERHIFYLFYNWVG